MAETLAKLRIIFYEEKDDKALRDIEKDFKENKRIPPFSLQNELRVMLELMDIVQNNLKKYPRTTVGDVQILMSQPLDEIPTNQRNTM